MGAVWTAEQLAERQNEQHSADVLVPARRVRQPRPVRRGRAVLERRHSVLQNCRVATTALTSIKYAEHRGPSQTRITPQAMHRRMAHLGRGGSGTAVIVPETRR